jgi:hypothetical protein
MRSSAARSPIVLNRRFAARSHSWLDPVDPRGALAVRDGVGRGLSARGGGGAQKPATQSELERLKAVDPNRPAPDALSAPTARLAAGRPDAEAAAAARPWLSDGTSERCAFGGAQIS